MSGLSMTMSSKESLKSDMNRITFLTTVTSGTASIIFTPSAIAADEKGTAKDPKAKYETCVANCVFECTKPKGEEQKGRTECLKECKPKCKEQPKASAVST